MKTRRIAAVLALAGILALGGCGKSAQEQLAEQELEARASASAAAESEREAVIAEWGQLMADKRADCEWESAIVEELYKAGWYVTNAKRVTGPEMAQAKAEQRYTEDKAAIADKLAEIDARSDTSDITNPTAEIKQGLQTVQHKWNCIPERFEDAYAELGLDFEASKP